LEYLESKDVYYLKELLLFDIPNNFHCVGTFWLTFVFVDTALLLFYFAAFAAFPAHYRVPFYGYVILKIATFALPILYISPNDRFYFWLITLVVLAVEVAITFYFC